ncbi:hypothetical protein GCM10010401_08180 [Rarobacter faecitabidus]
MGLLHYGLNQSYEFDDRTLNHLRSVITGKLLRQERFVLTWLDGGHQKSIWLHPGAHLAFEFDAAVVPELDRAWLTSLMNQANSPAGLRLAQANQ